MDDFDGLLERELRLMLDRVVASPAPARRPVGETTAVVEPAVASTPDHPVPPVS
jgi:hypothetical protein